MKEIALAGFMMTVEEWQSLDGTARAEIVAAVMQWEHPPEQSGSTLVLIETAREVATTSGTGE